jgi:Spy/CpxP family protein refolding chaperone
MTIKRNGFLAAMLGVASALSASAQGPGNGPQGMGPMGPGHGFYKVETKGPGMNGGPGRLLPPGTWWRDQQVATAIGLSADQQKKIDGLFLEARVQLIHMHATLEENQLRLDDTLSAPALDAAKAQKEIDEAADTRASLEKAEAHMLLSIRGVLSTDQWTKLQNLRPHGMVRDMDRGMDRGPRGPKANHRDGPQDNGMPHPPAAGQRPDGPPSPDAEDEQ